ncbi:hypothetical protein [Pseudoalteromonas sp. NBT06-2]|uniref:hypothetical protein n=1 Tax=Pseudoalteromonas sp. NBT06-2 TaxID=2025950 RepID=UPI00336BE983
MASFNIEKRAKVSGEFSYRCTVRVKESGKIIHRDSKTFSKKEVARNWGLARCVNLEEEGTLNKQKVVSLFIL